MFRWRTSFQQNLDVNQQKHEAEIHFTREKRACRAKPIRALSLRVHGKCKSEMSLWVLTRQSPTAAKCPEIRLSALKNRKDLSAK